jgi:hypothetical protein
MLEFTNVSNVANSILRQPNGLELHKPRIRHELQQTDKKRVVTKRVGSSEGNFGLIAEMIFSRNRARNLA